MLRASTVRLNATFKKGMMSRAAKEASMLPRNQQQEV
jgi:hypothetical protein